MKTPSRSGWGSGVESVDGDGELVVLSSCFEGGFFTARMMGAAGPPVSSSWIMASTWALAFGGEDWFFEVVFLFAGGVSVSGVFVVWLSSATRRGTAVSMRNW